MTYREYWYQGPEDDAPQFIWVGIPVRSSRLLVGWALVTLAACLLIF